MSAITMRRPRTLMVVTATLIVAALLFSAHDRAVAGDAPVADGIDVVYVALGTNFPDALAAGAAAGAAGAPVLLVPTNPPIPASIQDELLRLDPKAVRIVGGTTAVSQEMEDAIAALLPAAAVGRFAGGDRYATSATLSENVFPINRYVSVPGVAFGSTSPDTDDVTLAPTGVYGAVPLYAPIFFPDGAKILAFNVDVIDTDGADGIGVRLHARGIFTDVVIAETFSGDAYAGGELTMSDSSIDPLYADVDNSVLSYYLEVYASGASRKLIQVRVPYEVGSTN